MQMFEIPQEQWESFFDRLLELRRLLPVRLELASMDVGDQELAALIPLRNIDFEEAGSDRGSVLISVGDPEDELIHRVASPRVIYALLGSNGAIECVAIEEDDDSKTFLFFENRTLIGAGELIPE